MTKTRLFFSAILVLLGTLVLVPATTPGHAQTTGTICIIPSGATSCPSSSASIHGTMGTQQRVSIFIQNSAPLNGFDVTVLADHAILQPSGVDLTGSIFSTTNFLIVSDCIGGSGSSCQSTDTPDTIHLAAACFAQAGVCPPPSPTTGLLFTAIYNVVASTTSTPIGYQTGCSSSSVSGTTTCVTIANAGTIVPETVQTAVFSATDFTMTASPSSLTVTRSSQMTSTITLTSLSGFAGTVSLSTSVSPSTGHFPTANLSSSSVTLASGGTGSVVLTVSTGKNTGFGSYTITITGTSGSLTHTTTVTVTVTH